MSARMAYNSHWGKYHNKKVELDGEKFDSIKEMNRWQELKLLERAGVIHGLSRQQRFELIPAQKKNGKVVERPVTYIADFCYVKDGKPVVEDCKGAKTEVYKIKKKLMLFVHGVEIKET